MRERKPKGFWMSLENCEREVRAISKREKRTAVPTISELGEAGIYDRCIKNLGGREGIGKLLGLPLTDPSIGRPKAGNPLPIEKWDGKPSKAFEIEAEARKKGLSYADIQKAKTLAMVGGVQI